MSVMPIVRRLGGAAASLALVGGLAAVAAPSVAAADHPPLTVSKTVAHSGLDHGDEIDESGDGCVGDHVTGVDMWLAKGVVGDDEPIGTNLTGFGDAAHPDSSGHWEGGYSVTGGSPDLVLTPGTYTLRTECLASEASQDFIYAGVQITITDGDADASTTTTASDGSTTTTATTASSSTSTTAASTTTATKADPVSAAATFTG